MEVRMKFPRIIWIPRSMMVILAVFMIIFSLDVLGMEVSIWQKLLGLLMHNIPSLVMLLMLIITWKKPFFGAVFFFILGILLTIFFRFYQHWFTLLAFTAPLLIAGGLFLLTYYLTLRKKNEQVIDSHEQQLP
jgi:hypothetical protein